MADQLVERRYRFTVLRPLDAVTGRVTTALELPGVGQEHLDFLRQLIAPYLGAGFALAIDGAIVARGPEALEQPLVDPSSQQVQRLTEMAVQHHEYLCAELRRMREEYEQEFAQERAIMRALRQRWMERTCDDHGESQGSCRLKFTRRYSAARSERIRAPG